MSVISLLSSDTPNTDSPANVDAAKEVRENPAGEYYHLLFFVTSFFSPLYVLVILFLSFVVVSFYTWEGPFLDPPFFLCSSMICTPFPFIFAQVILHVPFGEF